MKKIMLMMVVLGCAWFAALGAASLEAKITAPAVLGRLPLHFVENQGQVDSPARFYTLGPGLQAGFSPGEITLAVPAKNGDPQVARRPEDLARGQAPSPPQTYQLVRVRPVNLSPAVRLTGEDLLPGKFNHYKGSDPAKWQSDIPIYGSVLYRQAYSGMDLRFYGQGQALEYDVIVQPGGDPSQVRFRMEGIQKLEVTPTGDLAVTLPGGEQFLQKKPLVYQEQAGRRVLREGKFRLYPQAASWEYGFEVAAYDRNRSLVIDPVLVYSTYFGGSNNDVSWKVRVTESGDAFVVGYTESSNFYTKPGSTFKGGRDVFVFKVNPTGKRLIFSTLLGGDGYDEGYGLALDKDGHPCICGQTWSDNFPPKNPLQATRKGSGDGFVARLNGTTGALLFSTYLGGKNEDKASDVKVDGAGNIYVVGSTKSDDLFNAPSFQYQGGWDAFVAKIGAGGLIWSTYLGGNGTDMGKALALDGAGNVYLTGDTTSGAFLPSPIRPYSGNGDAFVIGLKAPGNELIFTTYLGGSGTDYGMDIALDNESRIWVTGQTDSGDFFQYNSVHPPKGSFDAFLAKLSRPVSDPDYPGAQRFLFSTLLGGAKYDFANALAVDSNDYVYLTGTTYSSDLHLKEPWHKWGGGELLGTTDAFVAKFWSYGGLVFSTYLGGSGNESGTGVALDSAGNLFLVGTTTSSTEFPPGETHLRGYSGGVDVYLMKVGTQTPAFDPIMVLELLFGDESMD